MPSTRALKKILGAPLQHTRSIHLPRFCASPRQPVAAVNLRDTSFSRGIYTSSTLGDGNLVLRHIAHQGQKSFSKWSLDELLELKNRSSVERLQQVEEVLHVGISRIVMLLQDLPMGFGSTGPIRGVIEDYVQDVTDLRQISASADKVRFHECISTVFARHRGMMATIAQGLSEFQEEITNRYEPIGSVPRTKCADVTEWVPAMEKIELALDEFFTIRTTLRLLIAHCIQLDAESTGEPVSELMKELLVRVPDSVRAESARTQTRHVGAICLDTTPSLILIEAYRHVRHMCRGDQRAPVLLLNGIPSEEYLESNAFNDTNFPYVDIHLYFVFFELIKNALTTSLQKASPGEDPPAIHASLTAGMSLLFENERAVKITDGGEGIRREDRTKVWSYFYSTRRSTQWEQDAGLRRCSVDGPAVPLEVLDSLSVPDSLEAPGASGRAEALQFVRGAAPSATGDQAIPVVRSRGLGLPVSRVLVRYFGGEIDLNSIPNKGTDVHCYL